MKDFALFFDKESKRYTLNKEVTLNCIDVGTQNKNRHRLIFLPWNVKVNGEFFIALCSYRYLKEKIRLRVCPMLSIENNIEINLFYIGSLPIFQSSLGPSLVIKR